MGPPIGIVDILSTDGMRQRNKQKTDIQIVDEKDDQPFQKDKEENENTSDIENEDDEDIQEELNELEKEEQIEQPKPEEIKEQEEPFYPEPSKKKKNSKKTA
jgi:hypothetical protein